MKPDQVRFHHWRDFPWPIKYCERCGGNVTKWHEHISRPADGPDDHKPDSDPQP